MINLKKILFSITVIVAGLITLVTPVSASASVVYDALPQVVPQTSYPSLGFQATSTKELADDIHILGSDRTLDKVTVTLVTWARHSEYLNDQRYEISSTSWTHPITLTIYDKVLVDGIPTTVLAQKTVNVQIPWRPEGDSTCPDNGYGAGFAWRSATGVCLNGLAFNATFDFGDTTVSLPDDVIVGISYNTQSYGTDKLNVNGPYNSLNVAIPNNQLVTVGSDNNTDALYWDTTYPGYSGGLKLDSNWTPNGTIALKLETRPVLVSPSDKNQCKNEGWKMFNNPVFKNQGDCVSYVQSNAKALGNKNK